MGTARKHKAWAVMVALFVFLGLAALVGVAGCGGDESAVTTTYWRATDTTAAATATTTAERASESQAAPGQSNDGDTAAYEPQTGAIDQALATTALEAVSSQKVISDAQLEVEVEKGKFQTVFDQAMMIAKRYGGYLLSATAYASGEEDSLKSGTVAVRVPSQFLHRGSQRRQQARHAQERVVVDPGCHRGIRRPRGPHQEFRGKRGALVRSARHGQDH